MNFQRNIRRKYKKCPKSGLLIRMLASPCRDRRSTAVRSRSGSDTTPWCHSRPSRRFATSTVRKGINLIRRKQKDNPDRFSRSVGVTFYFIVVDTLIPPMPSVLITNNSVSVFLGSSVQSDFLNQYEGISIPPSCHKHKA